MPRSNTPKKGRGTSFGKQSDAEKSFYNRKKTDRFDDKRRDSPAGGDSEKKEFRRGPSFGKPFRHKGDESPRSDGPPRFTKSPRPAGDTGGFKRPFKKDGDSSFRPRTDGPPRFSKSPRKEGGDDFRPKKFDRDGKTSFSPRTDSPPRFTRTPRTEGGDNFRPKKFDRDGKNSFPPRSGPSKFSKSSRPDSDDKFRPKRTYNKEEGDSFSKRKDPPSFTRASKGNDQESSAKGDQKSFIQSRVVKSGEFTKTVKTTRPREDAPKKDDGLTRLNKYVANAGIGSRRQADEFIKMGLISVNGVAITELGTKVKQGDVVRYEDRILKAEKLVYVLLNKPKGFITTTEDPQERSTVMSIVAGACKERIYPVGRLDRNTTGLLLLTNDGDLADKLTHPSYKAKKVYKAELDKPLTKNDLQKIVDGVHLEEGKAMVDDIAIISDDKKTVGLEIHIGWNRVVRRIFESLGYEITRLDRSVFAGLDKKNLGRGQWRFLESEEVVRLKHFK